MAIRKAAASDSDQRSFPLNQRLVTAADCSKANQYQEFSLRFLRKPNQPILAGIVWKGKDRTPSLLTVDTVTLARCEAPLGIGSVRANRLWYRRNAGGMLTATVANRTDQPQQADLSTVADVATGSLIVRDDGVFERVIDHPDRRQREGRA